MSDIKRISDTTMRALELAFAERVARYVLWKAANMALRRSEELHDRSETHGDPNDEIAGFTLEHFSDMLRDVDPATLAREALEEKT